MRPYRPNLSCYRNLDEESINRLNEFLGICEIYGINSQKACKFVEHNHWRWGWSFAAYELARWHFYPEEPKWCEMNPIRIRPYKVNFSETLIVMIVLGFVACVFVTFISLSIIYGNLR